MERREDALLTHTSLRMAEVLVTCTNVWLAALPFRPKVATRGHQTQSGRLQHALVETITLFHREKLDRQSVVLWAGTACCLQLQTSRFEPV